ncbi:hypothetical protein MKX73_19305 [Solibacillus sp. FSL W7-1436]|uniref:hypothetical protein n=1 Tax=Solibacillus sp. FSL W7-1436 TaxID=2921705 RepID=UPI0030F533A5
MTDNYLYDVTHLNKKTEKELDQMLLEHGYDLNDFVDMAFRVEVLSHLIET